ncbi:hypothetical protein [Clostridium butyricum]|uniref:Uncharacterized protein n=1 Tax=Clostridium butyricum TaxID=1492 RepID=A0AAP9RKJ4_CLOBU|nr:hypothetical protein [Clostridium butyricum]MBZ5748630.1 hypothetical protein [Clostridium butyricum]QMW93445.1 hypothetical protein FF104_21275 [Clostridium butyricum]BBK79240.1 hypothetical protein Cbu04g_42480 [Clostridium butyricum]GEQ27706.1 hypothetical protein CBU03nite_41290 [Clostridium butyricum]
MKKIMKRFLILFLCFSLLSGIYTKKANAIAVVDDAFYIVAGVVVTGATIYALVDHTLSMGSSSHTANDSANISSSLSNTQKLSLYLTVKTLENGSKFLTWTKSGLDWLTNFIDTTINTSYVNNYGSIQISQSNTVTSPLVLSSQFTDQSCVFRYDIGYGQTSRSLYYGSFAGPYYVGAFFYNYNYYIGVFNANENVYSLPVSSVVNSFEVEFPERSCDVKDYSPDVVDYNFFNPEPEPDEDNSYKPKIGFPLREYDKNKDGYEPVINPDTGEEYEPYETPYTGDDIKENPDILVIPDGSTNPDPNPEPTPDPNPEPTPDPDPNPDTGNDEDKLPENDTPVLDFSPLYGATRKFPFCLPWDIYDCIKVFKSEEEPFKYEFKETKYSDTEIIIIPNFEIDFSKIPYIDLMRNILKLFLYYQFIRFLMISIRKVMWS